MELFIETLRSSTELTAGVSQTELGQGAPAVPPVYTSEAEAGAGTKYTNWRLTQTDGPATVETDCTNENTSKV